MSKSLKSFAALANVPENRMAVLGSETVIEVPVDVSPGKRQLFRFPNMADSAVEFHVIKTLKVNRSSIGAWHRVQVAAN